MDEFYFQCDGCYTDYERNYLELSCKSCERDFCEFCELVGDFENGLCTDCLIERQAEGLFESESEDEADEDGSDESGGA